MAAAVVAQMLMVSDAHSISICWCDPATLQQDRQLQCDLHQEMAPRHADTMRSRDSRITLTADCG